MQGKVVKNRTKFVPIVSSGRAAELIFRYWAKQYGVVPDAVVVEGPMAGGHLGFKKEEIGNPDYALERILPDVIAVMKIRATLRGKHSCHCRRWSIYWSRYLQGSSVGSKWCSDGNKVCRNVRVRRFNGI